MIGAVYHDPILGTTYTVKQEIEPDELGRRFLVHHSDWDATITMYLDAIRDWKVPACECGAPADALGNCLGSCQGESWDR